MDSEHSASHGLSNLPPEQMTAHSGRAVGMDSIAEPSIKLINVENGLTITQLTRTDLYRLAKIVAPDDLADKLTLFVAYLDGKNDVRGSRP